MANHVFTLNPNAKYSPSRFTNVYVDDTLQFHNPGNCTDSLIVPRGLTLLDANGQDALVIAVPNHTSNTYTVKSSSGGPYTLVGHPWCWADADGPPSQDAQEVRATHSNAMSGGGGGTGGVIIEINPT